MGAFDCVTANDGLRPTQSTEVFTVNLITASSLDVTRQDLESQLPKSTSDGTSSVWWTVCIDIPLILLAVLLTLLYQLHFIPSNKGGFYCNDPRLSIPFTGDTVSTAVLMVFVLLMPLIVMFVTEFIFFDFESTQRTRVCQAFRNTMWLYRSFMYGMFFNFGATELCKGIMGSPRPTFFDFCEPDTAKTCIGSQFVSTFECTSTRYSAWMLTDSYHSFFSGHTSFCVYSALFVSWYLQRRAFDWRHRTVFLVPFLQMACIAVAVFISLSRITDNRHHWWDVVIGAVVGVVILFYTVLGLCNNFSTSTKPSSDVINDR